MLRCFLAGQCSLLLILPLLREHCARRHCVLRMAAVVLDSWGPSMEVPIVQGRLLLAAFLLSAVPAEGRSRPEHPRLGCHTGLVLLALLSFLGFLFLAIVLVEHLFRQEFHRCAGRVLLLPEFSGTLTRYLACAELGTTFPEASRRLRSSAARCGCRRWADLPELGPFGRRDIHFAGFACHFAQRAAASGFEFARAPSTFPAAGW